MSHPFAIGERQGRRSTYPANELSDDKFIIATNHALIVEWNDLYVEKYGRHCTLSIRTVEPWDVIGGKPATNGYFYAGMDVMCWMWDNPRKVIETDWGDEHFMHSLTPVPNTTNYCWRQWGTQGDHELITTEEETRFILQELYKLPLKCAPYHSPFGDSAAIVRDIEEYELPGGCRWCEVGPDEPCDCGARDQPPEEDDVPWTMEDGKRYDRYKRGLAPFDYEANHIGHSDLLISRDPLYAVRYFPDYPGCAVRRGEADTFKDAHIYLSLYVNATYKGTFGLDADHLRRISGRVVRGTSGNIVETLRQVDPDPNPGLIEWSSGGVELHAGKHYKDEVSEMFVPWEVWNRLDMAAYEFLAWNGGDLFERIKK
jgi:hypothetical protein